MLAKKNQGFAEDLANKVRGNSIATDQRSLMPRIPGLSAVPLNEPKPLGFRDLHRKVERTDGEPIPYQESSLSHLTFEKEWDTAHLDRVITRLRAALKVCGFTTEEIDSIALDTYDGVRVSQYFEGKLTT